MKLSFKLILLIFSFELTARDIVQIQFNEKSNNVVINQLSNALTEHLGIPNKFIDRLDSQNEICKKNNLKTVIGICVLNKKVKIFYLNKRIYDLTIKKIIDQHLLIKAKNG